MKDYTKIKIPKRIFSFIKEVSSQILQLKPQEDHLSDLHFGEIKLYSLNNLNYINNFIAISLLPQIFQEMNLHIPKDAITLRHVHGIRSCFRGSYIETRSNLLRKSDLTALIQLDHKGSDWPIQICNSNNEWEEINLKAGEILVYNPKNCLIGRIDPLEGDRSDLILFFYKINLKNHENI